MRTMTTTANMSMTIMHSINIQINLNGPADSLATSILKRMSYVLTRHASVCRLSKLMFVVDVFKLTQTLMLRAWLYNEDPAATETFAAII